MDGKFTKRQRYLAAMRKDPADGELVWAPNFDYWLSVNSAQKTLPEAYRGMSRNDIVRSIGGTIWNRAGAVSAHQDKKIKHIYGKRPNGANYHEITTPIGSISEETMPTESAHSSHAHTKHLVKDMESLRVMTYVAQSTDYSVNFDDAQKAVEETGDDGIVLHQLFCVPLIQFAKTDAGYMDAFYMIEDYPEEVEALLSVYRKKYVETFKLLAATPADVIEFGDNMDEVMISPKLFERYAVDFYRECKSALGGSGKILAAHWCGRTQHLLPLVPKTGIEVVEAVVTWPMADITLEAALDALDGKAALQGGIPAVMVCPESVSRRDFEGYIESVALKQKGRPGFILGMSDNVPPNADFSRVEAVAELIKK
ncbi:MAG: uroporphyrinogen decarboxylase family protein [Oscillospiraceae bacterium]|nr:uroporphyrinogen decarboxylase family protein [Oscillospiraceae bacterium]